MAVESDFVAVESDFVAVESDFVAVEASGNPGLKQPQNNNGDVLTDDIYVN